MEEMTLFLWVVGIAGVICCLSGSIFLASPHMIHKINQGISRSIISLDETFMKYNRYAGLSFLVVGIVLIYFILRILII